MTPDEIAAGIDDIDKVGTLADELNATGAVPFAVTYDNIKLHIINRGSAPWLDEFTDVTNKVVNDLGIIKLWAGYYRGHNNQNWAIWAKSAEDEAFFSRGEWHQL